MDILNPTTQPTLKQYTNLFSIMSCQTRLKLLLTLAMFDGPVGVTTLSTLINQPLKNVQEQIRQLESFELIAITRQGKYKLAQRTNKTEQMLSELLELFNLHETPNSGVSSENHNA